MLMLWYEKDREILRDKNDGDLWKSIEEYAASGLTEISKWLLCNASGHDGVETILNAMKDQAKKV